MSLLPALPSGSVSLGQVEAECLDAWSRRGQGEATGRTAVDSPPGNAAGMRYMRTATASAPTTRRNATGWRASGALAPGVAFTLLTLSCGSRTQSVDYCVEFCAGRGATLESVAWIDGEISCFCRFPEE